MMKEWKVRGSKKSGKYSLFKFLHRNIITVIKNNENKEAIWHVAKTAMKQQQWKILHMPTM